MAIWKKKTITPEDRARAAQKAAIAAQRAGDKATTWHPPSADEAERAEAPKRVDSSPPSFDPVAASPPSLPPVASSPPSLDPVAGSDQAFTARGRNGQLTVTPTKIIISRAGAVGFLTQGLKGDKEID